MTSIGTERRTQLARKPRRLGYKKSKTGCQSCRARKVKCDEHRPRCLACERYDIECHYPSSRPPNSHSSPFTVQTPSQVPIPDDHVSDQAAVGAESRALSSVTPESPFDHLLELRLLHHFTAYTCKTLPGGDSPGLSERWAVHVPPLAFDHNPLLQAIFAVSSAHLRELCPNNPTYKAASRHYFDVALSEHNRTVSTLSRSTADLVCLTCLLISVLAFNFDRLDENYTAPPMQGLFISYGVIEVSHTAWSWIRNDETSEASKLMMMSPQFQDFDCGSARVQQFDQLQKYLMYPDEHIRLELFEDEHYEPEVEKAFRQAITYIDGVQRAIQAQESELILCQRIKGFPASVPKILLQLANDNQPRALVILAHYFALTKSAPSVWWLRGLASSSVNTIFRILPKRWRPLMHSAFEMMGEALPEDTVSP